MSRPGLVRIGCGAGFAGDRFDGGLPVVESLAAGDGPAYLMYEVLGERTLALVPALMVRSCAKMEEPSAWTRALLVAFSVTLPLPASILPIVRVLTPSPKREMFNEISPPPVAAVSLLVNSESGCAVPLMPAVSLGSSTPIEPKLLLRSTSFATR